MARPAWRRMAEAPSRRTRRASPARAYWATFPACCRSAHPCPPARAPAEGSSCRRRRGSAVVRERQQLEASNRAFRSRATRRRFAPPPEPAFVSSAALTRRGFKSKRPLRTVADPDGAELGAVLANPVLANAEHRRDRCRVDMVADPNRHGAVRRREKRIASTSAAVNPRVAAPCALDRCSGRVPAGAGTRLCTRVPLSCGRSTPRALTCDRASGRVSGRSPRVSRGTRPSARQVVSRRCSSAERTRSARRREPSLCWMWARWELDRPTERVGRPAIRRSCGRGRSGEGPRARAASSHLARFSPQIRPRRRAVPPRRTTPPPPREPPRRAPRPPTP